MRRDRLRCRTAAGVRALGRVVKGLATAERIDALGDSQSGESGTPVPPVLLERAGIDAS